MHPYPIRPPGRGQHPPQAAWRESAWDLAAWADQHLVNRTDCYGGYYRDRDGKTWTTTRKECLDHERLAIHFAGGSIEDVVGVHVTSWDEMCRWVVVDIDAHDGDGADPEANFRFARHVRDRASAAKFAARLVDSNGKGGYHVWILLGAPVPNADAWRLGKWLVHDHEAFGFSRPPETFPKSPQLGGKRYGGWGRLPGRHPKRNHWSKVWSPRRQVWLVGHAAIASLLKFEGRPVDLARVIPADFTGKPPREPRARPPAVPRADRGEDQPEIARVRSALTFLGEEFYDDYAEWITIGLALRELGDDGFELWDEWSQQSGKYDAAEMDGKWGSFDNDETAAGRWRAYTHPSVTLGSLFHWARVCGWPGTYETTEPNTGIVITSHGRAGQKTSTHIPG